MLEASGCGLGISAMSLSEVVVGPGLAGTEWHAVALVVIWIGVVAGVEEEIARDIGDRGWKGSNSADMGWKLLARHTAGSGYGDIVAAGGFGVGSDARRPADLHIGGTVVDGAAVGDHTSEEKVLRLVDRREASNAACLIYPR